MQILAIRLNVADSDGDHLAHVRGIDSLDDVLRRSDHVVLTLPLTDASRGLIGARELAAMKPTAVLVNISRAEVVDGAALYDALAGRRLGGAALDVWYNYPTDASPTRPAPQPFDELPNVLMTPHVSGWTDGMLDARARLIAENIERAERGEPPVNEITAVI